MLEVAEHSVGALTAQSLFHAHNSVRVSPDD